MSHFELTSQKGFMNNLRWHQIVKSFLCRYISGRLLEQNISSQPYFRAQITEIKNKDIFYWNPQDIGRFLFLPRAFLWLLYHNSILSIILIILRYHTMFYIIIPLNNILFRSGSHLVSRLTNQSFDCYPARALRALGLLLADGVLTVGWGKTIWRVGQCPLTKTTVTLKRKAAK